MRSFAKSGNLRITASLVFLAMLIGLAFLGSTVSTATSNENLASMQTLTSITGTPIATATPSASATISIAPTPTVSSTTSTTTQTSTIFVFPSSTHVFCTPDRSRPGQHVDCTGIVSSKNGGTPSGSIFFAYIDGKSTTKAAPVNCYPVAGSSTECAATISFLFPHTGTVTVIGAYSGDLTHQTSRGATLVHVVRYRMR